MKFRIKKIHVKEPIETKLDDINIETFKKAIIDKVKNGKNIVKYLEITHDRKLLWKVPLRLYLHGGIKFTNKYPDLKETPPKWLRFVRKELGDLMIEGIIWKS